LHYLNILSEIPKSEDCKDWNDVLVENHFNNKVRLQTKDYSNVIVFEKNEYAESSKSKKNKIFINNAIINCIIL